MLTKRTNILFDENMWEQLLSLADKKNTSVSDLVRSAVVSQYFRSDARVRMIEAIEKIRSLRIPQTGKIHYKELINDGRKY